MHKILSILFGLVAMCCMAQNPNPKIYMRYGDGKSNTLIVTNGAYFASADDMYTVTTNMNAVLVPITNDIFGIKFEMSVVTQKIGHIEHEMELVDVYSGTNIVGYVLGSQTNKVIQPAGLQPDLSAYMPKSGGTFSGPVTVSSSFSSGSDTTASGNYSHAEGDVTTSSGYASHAEGSVTEASGYASHAEGGSTTASVDYSHAEGNHTTASGYASHAEGGYTEASGHSSHAAGVKSVATNNTAFVWQGFRGFPGGDYDPEYVRGYGSHGDGTFNINPVGGASGVWIGNATLYSIVYESEVVKSKTSSGEPLHNVFVVKDPSDNSFSLVEITQ